MRKYAYILQAKQYMDDQMRTLLFFTPSEELHGGNIFARVAHKFSVIQPFLDKIDREFIDLMNKNVCNTTKFI